MSHLRVRDYQAVLDLCSAVAQRPHPVDRTEVFLTGCQKLCGAAVLALLSAPPGQEHFPVRTGLFVGFDQGPIERLQEWYFAQDLSAEDLFNQALWSRGQGCYRRRDIIENADWYGHPQVAEGWRWVGLDDTLASVSPLPEGHALLVAMRAWGDRPFSTLNRTMLELLTRQFRWLFESLYDSGHLGEQAASLPPRLRAILNLLLQGRSEKQMAHELDLSPRTVNKYVEQIMRFHQVHSRAELMAQWICHPPEFRSVRQLSARRGFTKEQ